MRGTFPRGRHEWLHKWQACRFPPRSRPLASSPSRPRSTSVEQACSHALPRARQHGHGLIAAAAWTRHRSSSISLSHRCLRVLLATNNTPCPACALGPRTYAHAGKQPCRAHGVQHQRKDLSSARAQGGGGRAPVGDNGAWAKGTRRWAQQSAGAGSSPLSRAVGLPPGASAPGAGKRAGSRSSASRHTCASTQYLKQDTVRREPLSLVPASAVPRARCGGNSGLGCTLRSLPPPFWPSSGPLRSRTVHSERCGGRRLAPLPPSGEHHKLPAHCPHSSRGTYSHACFSPTPGLTRRGEVKQAALGPRALLPRQAGRAGGVALGSGHWGVEQRRLCLAGSLPIGPCLLPLHVRSARGRKWGTGGEGTRGSRPPPESHPQRANVPRAPTQPAPCSQQHHLW